MKLSEFWLREWLNLNLSTTKLAEQITMIGLEVDSIEPVVKKFTGIVIGKITRCQHHPNNKKLNVVEVDIGADKFVNVICDANNCRTGIMVVIAKVGASLPNGNLVKEKYINGKSSKGLLCSFSKLGLHIEDDKKIIELPYCAPIGCDIRKYLKFDDNIFNINITPNRSDCLGIIGIARDISVYNRAKLIKPNVEKIELKINDKLPLHINEPSACPRYLNRIVKNVNTSMPTPLWMKEKLRRCGIILVNTIINIANYVLLELGQPINIFLLNEIKGGIIIRFAKENESVNIIGNKFVLSSDTLIISDYKKVLTVAGILNRSIINTKNSNDIVLECAFFQPLIIQNYSKRYYFLSSDIKNIFQRYERGIDSNLQLFAIERFTSLLLSICGGYPGPIVNFTYKKGLKRHFINLRRNVLYNRIGFHIPDSHVIDIIIRLGCKVNFIKSGWKVLTPSWRFDIYIEEDLIEEIIRIYGYNKIPSIPIHTKLMVKQCNKKNRSSLLNLKTILVNRGYYEVINYSFVNPKNQSLIHPEQKPLKLLNPISDEMSVMRLSLWTGLIQSMIYNKNRQQHRIKLFEVGLTFVPDQNIELKVKQNFMIGGLISGYRYNEHWDIKERLLLDFYDIKGDVESLMKYTCNLKDVKFMSCNHPALHPGKSASIYFNNEFVGLVGAIHPIIESKLKLNTETLVFELYLDKISNFNIQKFKQISCFPISRRDISIIVKDNINAGDIVNECKTIIGKYLFDINLFDIYQGKNISKGYKSIAISLLLQDTKSSMKEDEINTIVNNCIKLIHSKFNILPRKYESSNN